MYTLKETASGGIHRPILCRKAWVSSIRFDGNALSTTDTYSTKSLIIDLYGKWESFDALSDQDGNDQVTGMFRVGYSSAAGGKGSFKIVNETATLP